MRTIGNRCPKRRLRVFYVTANGIKFAVWSHSRTAAEIAAQDAAMEMARGD